MSRRPRITLPGVPMHIVQRGHNGQPCFVSEEDYSVYLDWLVSYARECDCAVHAFSLMPDHLHLLMTPLESNSAGALMKRLGQRYSQYANGRHNRRGTLWEGRFRSCLTEEARYVLACYRYIELNPVRIGLVEHPKEYLWSSYRTNAEGDRSSVLVPHPAYTRLGASPADRRAEYQILCESPLGVELIEEIRSATDGNYVLGSPSFRQRMTDTLRRRVAPGRPGRPRKIARAQPAASDESE